MHPDRIARLPQKVAALADPPNFPKKALFEESDSDSDDGGAAVESGDFKVNSEYAKRFEHNKKREERQRLEEKFKKEGNDEDASDSESSDETEDEDAFLATEDLDARISETLHALRTKDPRIYDKNAKFFSEAAPAENGAEKKKKEKPMFLKDYHRERYMAGATGASDSEPDDEDAEKPKTYVEEQADLKKAILAEIDAAATGGASDDDNEDEGFLKPKPKSKKQLAEEQADEASKKSSAVLTEADIQNADKNPELYLSNFMAARAWVGPDGSNWKAFESDDGDSDLEKADEIEAAYNMRFEDPSKSNEILKSYARDVAAQKSVRREKMSARQRQREAERERKEEEKKQRKEEKARLKKLKLEEAKGKLEKIKKTAGLSGKELSDDQLLEILNDAWDDDRWEEEMKKRFGEEYYNEDDNGMASSEEDGDEDAEGSEKKKKKKKPKKPKWDDDIDITDVVKDYEDDAPAFTLSDIEEDQEMADAAADDQEEASLDSDSDSDSRPSKKRKTSKDHKKDRLAAKRASKQERARLEALVSTKLEIDDPDLLALGASASSSKKSAPTLFRWRETSPRSFGMTARDVLLAPSDKALNQFAGIKKYASFRDPEQKRKDKKSLSKKARLKKWRREVFGREYEETGPDFGFDALEGVEDDAEEIRVKKRKADDEDETKEKKKKKRKRGHKQSTAEV